MIDALTLERAGWAQCPKCGGWFPPEGQTFGAHETKHAREVFQAIERRARSLQYRRMTKDDRAKLRVAAREGERTIARVKSKLK